MILGLDMGGELATTTPARQAYCGRQPERRRRGLCPLLSGCCSDALAELGWAGLVIVDGDGDGDG